MIRRLLLCAVVVVAGGCNKGDSRLASHASALLDQPVAGSLATSSRHLQQDAAAAAAAAGARKPFAGAPDRGELVQYTQDRPIRRGPYTWHRADLSEAYALRAIATGTLRVTAPDGAILQYVYDRMVEHPSGDWTWVGHLAGSQGQQAIITFGAQAAFGSLGQANQLPLKLTAFHGASYLIQTDARQLAGMINTGTRPTEPDFHIPTVPVASGLHRTSAAGVSAAAATTAPAGTSTTTVDVVIGYTPGFRDENGGTSGAVTRINYLVDVANQGYINSNISAQVRLLATMLVNYADNTSNDSMLSQLTGYDASSNTETTPNPAFNALRAARDSYGADLVSVVRKFTDPENAGCGIAWLVGGGKQAASLQSNPAGWAFYGYSVVSDGQDLDETDSKTYYCRDETLAHEMGHNMGAAHDRVTAEGDDGVLDDPDDYGAFAYSFGYKTAIGNFYTIMAYGDSGQTLYRTFSTPLGTFCGGRPCGTANDDNARTLRATIPSVATFRATVVPLGGLKPRTDFDNDGHSDLLWRNQGNGSNVIWRTATSTTAQAVSSTSSSWRIAGIGDLNGDGFSDIVWRNSSSGQDAVWYSAKSASGVLLTTVTDQSTKIMGVGDFDGDGRDDLLWHSTKSGHSVIWKAGNSGTTIAVSAVPLQWTISAVGDVDGDGRADIVWRNLSTGQVSLWRSGNAATGQSLSTVSDLHWSIVGIGDFNGDGKADLLWRNSSTGSNVIWKTANSATAQAVASTSLSWKVGATDDYNGDGIADIVWRNSGSGANVLWKSANSADYVNLASASLSWSLAR